ARAETASIEAEADSASQGAFEADNEVSSLHAEIERSRDRLSHLDERLNTGRAELDTIQSRSGELTAELELFDQRLDELSKDERAREADALQETEMLSGLQGEEARASEEVLELRRQSGELTTQAAALDARLDGLSHRVSDARARRDRVTQEREGLGGEMAALVAKKNALERAVADLAEGKLLTVAEREALGQEMQSLLLRQRESEKAVDSVKNEVGLRRNRLRVLADLHRRLEGVGAGARALLSKSDPRVLGMVADRLEAPEELTHAVAGLLGDRLQAVVVEDQTAGLQLLEELARSERGRAEIIGARPAYSAGGLRSWEGDPLVLGRLSDRLRYSDTDEPLVRAVVGNAVLVKTAQDASEVARRHPGVTAVAYDGTVARPDGTISGGSGDDVASGMLEQKREMHQLTSELERLEAESARLIAEHNAIRARVTEVTTALDRARQQAHEGELAHVTAEKDLVRTASEMTRIEARLSAIDVEIQEIDRGLETTNQSESELRTQLDQVRAELEHRSHALSRAEDNAAGWRERVSAQASLVTERRVRLAQIKEQLESARTARERVESTLIEHRSRTERLNVELDEAAAAYGETAARILIAREARLSAATRAREAHAHLDSARLELERVRNALSSREAELKQVREALATHDEAAKKHEMAVQRLELEREHLENGIRERFRGLQLARVVGDYHARPAPDPEHRRRIDELTQLIDRMGPVNLDAKAEHQDAERRFKELNDQKVDIEKALEELDHAIRHMNRESRRRFRETFDEVNT
ncbi:MAG TPA: chromosome segregation protein SMC, partial [Polyangiaceae bacterium]